MCFDRKKKEIKIEPITTSIIVTPKHISIDEKLKELEKTIDEIIKQLNNHFEFKIKTDAECLENIYNIIYFTMKKFEREPS